ncbi:glycoside hydrolase family 2 protein [Roseateles sp.]|uniref:glycoside hydrolase family 2 protein n=1 Tax=Roseateles sp. TaxID=1971397 RepID=UPI002F42F4EB
MSSKSSARIAAMLATVAAFATTAMTATTAVAQPTQDAQAVVAPAPHVRLTTPWTDEALKAAVPFPEYPRPQLVRAEWLNLNGQWDYWGGKGAPDARLAPSAAPRFPEKTERVRVPYPVESMLSGVERLGEVNLWYRRSFEVPAAWKSQRVRINFGAVDRLATIYVNGTRVGQHEGGYTSFGFDITPLLKPGRNEVVVAAFDPSTNDGTLGKQSLKPGGIFYTPSSGIWQTVWLEPVGQAHIAKLDMAPVVGEQRLALTVRVGETKGLQVEAVALKDGQVVGRVRGAADKALSLPVPQPRLWSPDDPFLYDLKVTLRRDGKVVDQVDSYFGMRSIEVGMIDGVPRPLLNGKFVFQFGPLDQGFWPDGLYTAPTDAALRFDLEETKKLGFNMVRKHIKVEPARWFHYADKLGLLVWQDMPQAWDAETDLAVRAKTEVEWREIVDQLRSETSIVTWVIFNESWGDFEHRRMAAQFRAMDPTRLINAHSGINFAPHDEGGGDLIDLHDYPGPAAPTYQPWRIAVLGEYGGNSLKVPGHMYRPESKCCYHLFDSAAAINDAYVAQIDKLRGFRADKGLSAAIYTETTDVEEELNGFFTYDRRVKKLDFDRVSKANKALIDGR